MARVPGRWPIVRMAIREGRRAALAALRDLPGTVRPARAPDRILFAPRDLRSADPTFARDMIAGLFAFGGRHVEKPGVSPFRIEPPDPAWSQDLYGFGWLRHVRAADSPAARDLARALVAEAVGPGRAALRSGPGAAAPVVARRVSSFLAQSPMLLPGADPVFFRRFLRLLGRDVAILSRAMRDAPVARDRLAAAIAFCTAALCCGGFERRARRGNRILARELTAQILPDGGHLGRNPGLLLDLLLDLLPLRLLYASRAVPVPPALDLAIDRMMPMLRFFRLGSGDLALFNGMGRTPLGELVTVLAQDRTGARPVMRSGQSGYDRLEAGSTVVVVEDGVVPPPDASAEAHAGCLSFEMSSGPDLLVVNCGASSVPQLREISRRTAAHSTLSIGTASSGAALDPPNAARIGWPAPWLARRLGPALVAGPTDVPVERGRDGDRNIVLSAHHDGYRADFGVIHTRRLQLSQDGSRLDGLDTMTLDGRMAGPVAAVLRFHLHPAVRPRLEPGGTVTLDLPAGGGWRFVATDGAPVRLEDSAYLAVSEGRRATRQITVALATGPDRRRAAVAWSLVQEREPR